MTITGTAANGTFAYGVFTSAATVTSNSGTLTFNGTSCGTGDTANGTIGFIAINTTISATSNGKIVINGCVTRPGNKAGQDGVAASGNTSIITTNGDITIIGNSIAGSSNSAGINLWDSVRVIAGGSGNLTVTGIGSANTSAATEQFGIWLENSVVLRTNGTGTLTLNGTGGASSSAKTDGIKFDGYGSTNPQVSSNGGAIILNGMRGANSSSFDVNLYNRANVSTSSNITVTANSLNISSDSVLNATSAGNVLIQTLGAGVNLGNGTDTSANLGLSLAECNQITANLLTIGSNTTGQIVVTSNITRLANRSLMLIANNTASNITINANTSLSTFGSGSISLSARKISISGNITTNSGDIAIYGNGGGSYQSGSFTGVEIGDESFSDANVNTTGGNIVINGRGSSNSSFHGVYVNRSRVNAGGNGSLSITGISSNGTNNSYGVKVFSDIANRGCVTTTNGTLTIIGISNGTGTNAIGACFESSDSNISATGTGSINITGSTPGNTTGGTGIYLSSAVIKSNAGLITLNSNSLNLGGTVNATTAGNVRIQTLGAGVNLGNGTDTAANLGLSQSELNQITANLLTIGNSTTGTIAITANMAWPTNLTLLSGSLISGVQNANTLTQGNSNITSTGLLTVSLLNYSIGITTNSPVNYGTTVLLTATLTHSGSSFNSGTISFYNNGSLLGTGNISGDVATYSWAGAGAATYSNITASGNVTSAASNGSNTANVTVNPYSLTVTANNQTKAYGVAVPTLTYTNSPLVNGDSASIFSGNLATSATANSPVGYYPITIGSLATNANYSISSFTNGTLSESEELTTLVTTSTDSTDPYDNVVSLREAISYGTTLTGNQTITFSSGIYTSNLSTITLTQGVLTINDNTGLMSIQGPAASSGTLLTISGNNASGIFKVLSNATISNMTLTNGTGANGTSPNIQGGAIYSSSTLVLSNVTINNSTANYGSAIYQSGGVLNVNSSPISNSIYVDNSGDLIISGAQSAVLPQITACSLSVNISGRSITQAAGSNIQVSGTARFVSTGEVILANSTNDFATLNATGTNVTINDSNSLILGTIRSNQLNVNLPSGAVSQSPGTNIVASGVASFTTSGNVTLSNAINNFGTFTASGANITISDADNLNIGSIQSTGNLTITSGGTTNLSANITTTGDQLFNRPVILTNNVTLRTTANGNATFVSTLNGAYTLTANLGLGSLNNRGTVGSCTTLNLASVGSISGSDLNLTIAPGAVIGSITGNGSNNTITVQSLSNETSNIVISGTNSGNITSSGGTSVGSFTGITRIVGGAGSDTFKFINNSALLNGTIDGGSGTNALNYGGTTKPTFINLGTGQATGVTSTTSTGVVTNIQNVFGGTGNDFLTGSAASNVMDGGAGDDTMSGLGGNDIMVGNYGADNMNGGAGIDILIGGYVDFVVGSLQEGLESIMSTWNNVTDGTFNAVSNTIGTASSTQPRLVGDTNLASTYQLQTVFNDQATDRLTDIASSTTPNWFFATERVTQGNDVVLAGTTFTVSKKTVTSKTGRTER